MRILDSRRLTGPSLLLDGPGAILDVVLEGVEPERAAQVWRDRLEILLDRIGWLPSTIVSRAHAAGLSLAFTAPADTLYAATEVNEAAWRATELVLAGQPAEPVDPVVRHLVEAIAHERKPWLERLAEEARVRGVALLADDRRVSVGLGIGSRAWPVEDSPVLLERIPWSEIRDVPVGLVTGTNGKTTTVRLLGAMVAAAGLTAGVTSTDHVTVGDEVVASGDYSGPNGARTVLRDRRVEIALLELARGGLLRRGLALPHATAALVTNVANDHLGEFGVFDLETLADVKMVVAKAIDPTGHLVLNADDPRLLERGRRLAVPVLWFTLDARHPVVAAHLEEGGTACVLEGDRLVILRGAARTIVASLAEVPITFGGTARHNVANALAAIGAAAALGLPLAAIRAGLQSFDSGPGSNPGRVNVWRLRGVTAIVDFAHNPHGLAALAHMAAAMPATRRALVIGQAGDRDDDAIREFARVAWAMRPDHVFIKEMEVYLRGRAAGVVPAMIDDELRRSGARADQLSYWPSEVEAIRSALAWAREGDLLLLTTHAQRDEVIAWLTLLEQTAWQPGTPLPQSILSR